MLETGLRSGHPVLDFAILGAAGVASGIINTIAGGGTFLTLPILLGMGLSSSVANGTIRIGVVLQNVTSLLTFHRRQRPDYRITARLVAPMSLGALGGAVLATQISAERLKSVFGIVFLLWAVVLLVRPGRFLRPHPTQARPPGATALLAVAIGGYGGFLQAGVGFPLMALLVLVVGLPPVQANAHKVALALVFTLLTLPVFAWHGQIAWVEGLVLAAGATLGGWVGTRWQLKAGAPLVRWFVLIMVLISGILMLLT